jgi:endonuclease/exonuclease/phosphatase family metal-dependent hydrolase
MPRRRRSPRGALAVVTALVTLSGLASVSAAATPVPTSADSRTVLSWNVCGGNNSGCHFYRAGTAALTGTVRARMRASGALAGIFQEVCRSVVRPLEAELERHYGTGWDVHFAPIKVKRGTDPDAAPAFQCDRGRGDYGIVVAVPAGSTSWQVRYLPSPEGEEWRVAACATVPAWRLRVCNAHLSYDGDDPTYEYRRRQLPDYLALVAGERVIFGGDLNLRPESPEMSAAYASYVECAQPARDAPRTGAGTSYASDPHDDARTVKIDYLFTDAPTAHGCGTPTDVVTASDHRPLWIRLPPP